MFADPNDSMRTTVALGCRVLARAGLMENVLGHVSVRTGPDRMLIRCRGPQERGLLFTTREDIHEVTLDGAGDLPPGYSVPHELPIHAEILRARSEVGAVVHAHPPAAVVAALAEVSLAPVFGAYNIPAMRLALSGVPVYRRSVLVRRPELGRELVAAMEGKSVCFMLGHGMTSVGERVEQAVVRALDLDVLARTALALASVGGTSWQVPAEDIDELPDLGSELNDLAAWRFHVARLEHEGLGLLGSG
jgi:ribulose-5-phosphate 4-epimerase/fuculose-1-phosphate aldolase